MKLFSESILVLLEGIPYLLEETRESWFIKNLLLLTVGIHHLKDSKGLNLLNM